MSENNKKTLAKIIKADLQDVLTNDGQRGEGYFLDYQAFDDGDIEFHVVKNEELKRELTENFQRNIQKRREKFEKEKKKHEVKGKYWPDDITWQNQEEREIKWVWKEDLDKLDHQEIISLFSQIKQLFEDKKKQKWQGLNDKLANNSQLFHGCIDEGRGITWKVGRYVKFFGKEKGKNYTLAIPANHSALTKFKDSKVRFYLIKGTADIPIEKTPSNHWSTGENNLHNFYKFVELKDNITITPYNEENVKISNSSKDKNLLDKTTITDLVKYFREKNIKQIILTPESNLEIEYNGQSNKKFVFNTSERELQVVIDYCQKNQLTSLDQQYLNSIANTNSHTNQPPKNSSLPILLVFGGVLLLSGIVIGLLMRKKILKHKK